MGILVTVGFTMMALLLGCATGKPDGQDAEIYLVYSTSGGAGAYESGDRYGHKLEIYRNGRFHLYRLIYHEEKKDDNNGSTLQDNLIREGELDTSQLDSLRSFISDSGYFSLPSRLPNVNPREVEHRTPAETITISITKDDGTTHRVQSHMGVDKRHYPNDFIEIHRFLRNLQQGLFRE